MKGTEFFNAMIKNEPERRMGITGVWDWMVDHPREVLDAYVSVGALEYDEFDKTWELAPPPKVIHCLAVHPTLYHYTDKLKRFGHPLACTRESFHDGHHYNDHVGYSWK